MNSLGDSWRRGGLAAQSGMAPAKPDVAGGSAHLDQHGWCVFRGVITPEAAEESRAMMDELLADEREEDREGRAYQRRPWPERSAEEGGGPTVSGRTVTGQGFTAQCEHPLHDARAALTVPHLAPIMSQLLRCTDAESELCLIHQNFRRTDPSPGPHPPFIGEGRLDGTQASFHVRSPQPSAPSLYPARPPRPSHCDS